MTSYYNRAGPRPGRKCKYSQRPQSRGLTRDNTGCNSLTLTLTTRPQITQVLSQKHVMTLCDFNLRLLAALGKHSKCHAQTRLLVTPPAVMCGKCLYLCVFREPRHHFHSLDVAPTFAWCLCPHRSPLFKSLRTNLYPNPLFYKQ